MRSKVADRIMTKMPLRHKILCDKYAESLIKNKVKCKNSKFNYLFIFTSMKNLYKFIYYLIFSKSIHLNINVRRIIYMYFAKDGYMAGKINLLGITSIKTKQKYKNP